MQKRTNKTITSLLLIILLVITVSCNFNKEIDVEIGEKVEETKFQFWTWTNASQKRTDESYQQEYAKYKANGIDAVLINTGTNAELLARVAPIAIKEGLEVHAWMFTINRPGDKIANEHPEWFAVGRDGKSCFDEPPYVGYYKWLCPTRPEAKAHILSLVESLAKVEGVTSVHLDYIRYSDIYLPVGLLPKYKLTQETELPEFDFCYCDVCMSEFEKEHHKNPKEFTNSAVDIEWKQFRLNKVKSVVDDAYKIAHKHNKILTAAVFPYPEMADHMVRQRWDKWNVDKVLPMIYHSFYNEELDWIGYATGQGVKDLEGRNTELHTGLYIPAMNAEELKKAITYSKENGAKGVAFFSGGALKEDHLKVLKEFKEKLK